MTDPLTGLAPPGVSAPPDPGFAARLRQRIVAIENRADRATPAPGDSHGWHLAQLNLGTFLEPLDAPTMAPFADALDRINAIADAAPGFVWRLTTDEGGPSSNVEVPGVHDPLVAPNLTVWTDLESLRSFMYRTDHASYLRRRSEWFESAGEAMTVAWWIPAGTLPTLEDAVDRLERLRERGPSDAGFPLARKIPPPPARSSSGQVFIPYLTVGDTRAALLFYEEVFGAVRSGEFFEMDDGRVGHAEMTLAGQVLYMADEFPAMNLRAPHAATGNSVSLIINVDDCDAVYNHALAAGATGERAPTNQHGNRSAWLIDPWGHRWSPTSAAT